MRALWIEPDEDYLAKRRRLGHDRKDELWDGVLHMVPQPVYVHGTVSAHLFLALHSIAAKRGLLARGDGIHLCERGTDRNYRVPDGVVYRRDHIIERGLEGAELVIEVLSPNDESRDKFPFYAKLGVSEVWIVEPRSLVVEIYTLSGGAYVRVPTIGTTTVSPQLDITLELTDGPALLLRDAEVTHIVRADDDIP